MPKGVKGFQGGDLWNGYTGGSKKKEFRRDDFTDEFFGDNKETIRLVGQDVLAAAIGGQKWAVELVWHKFFTNPKNRDDFENAIHTNIVGTLSQMPQEKLVQIQLILLEQMNAEGEG